MPFEIVYKKKLAPRIKMMGIRAPLIAKKAKPGQFAILRIDERGERFPLTIIDWERERGVIFFVFEERGLSTRKLGMLNVGDHILDVVGPLGNPTNVLNAQAPCLVAEEARIASLIPRLKALVTGNKNFAVVLLGRSDEKIILRETVETLCNQTHIIVNSNTDALIDEVLGVLERILERKRIDMIFVTGSIRTMRAISELTKEYRVRTIVDLSPLMLDGLGMCGCCRVSVGGVTKFACVDGPEFDGHEVDFEELAARVKMFEEEEKLILRTLAGGEDA